MPQLTQVNDELVSLREICEFRFSALDKLMQVNDRRYMEIFAAQKSALELALSAARDALEKDERNTDKRFESVNEFRSQLNDVVTHLMPRSESTSRYQALSEKVDTLQARIDKSEGSGMGMRTGWQLLVGGIALLATILAIFGAFAKAPAEATVQSARLTDMVNRIDSLSARINALTPSPNDRADRSVPSR